AGPRELLHPAGAERRHQARRPARARHGVESPRADRRGGPENPPRRTAPDLDDPQPPGVRRKGTEAGRPGAGRVHQQHGIRARARGFWSLAMPVPDVDRYRPDDKRHVEALYRRVFGTDMAEASRLRWDWQYRRNPNNPGGEPEIWIAREGPAIVGQYATMPVRLSIRGREVKGSWGMDVMVAPERQRRGLGEVLFRTWDRNVGASLGLGLSDASYQLFQKLHWPDVGPVPCLVKPLSRRAFRHPRWPVAINRLISAVTWPVVLVVSRTRPLRAEVRLIQRFDESFTQSWETLAPKFDLAVRRDAAYLNW